MADEHEPQAGPGDPDDETIERSVWNLYDMRDDLVEGGNYYIRAIGSIDAPERREVVEWLERFAEHGAASDEFLMEGIGVDAGDSVITLEARSLHTALAASLALFLSPDEEARAMMLTVEEFMERMETPEVIGRWE